MAEAITILIAVPLLYAIGEFYYRLAVWLVRTIRAGIKATAKTGEAS